MTIFITAGTVAQFVGCAATSGGAPIGRCLVTLSRGRPGPAHLCSEMASTSYSSDKASNCRLARRQIQERFAIESKGDHLLDFRCMAHSMNLVACSVAKSPLVYNTLERLRELIGIISGVRLLADRLI